MKSIQMSLDTHSCEQSSITFAQIAIIVVLGMKNVIPKAIPRGVLLQQENRPFPRTLSSESDSNISYNRKGVAGRAVRRKREWKKAGNRYKQCS